MLKTRLLLGSLMAAAAGGVLYVDSFFAPYFPILLVLALAVGMLATRELVALIAAENRPREWLCLLGVITLVSMPFAVQFLGGLTPTAREFGSIFAASLLLALLVEMYHYREPGQCVTRAAQQHGELGDSKAPLQPLAHRILLTARECWSGSWSDEASDRLELRLRLGDSPGRQLVVPPGPPGSRSSSAEARAARTPAAPDRRPPGAARCLLDCAP